MTSKEAMRSIKPVSQTLRRQAKRRQDQVVGPLGNLEVLEEDIICIAAVSDSLAVNLHPGAIVIMCRSNGIIKEGVTQTGQEVTVIVAGNTAQRSSCVCPTARQAGADVIPVDTGMACRGAAPSVVDRKMAYETKDFLGTPAMIRGETVKAMEAGADMAVELKERGYALAGSGEIGIGNTTTSSAFLSMLLDMDPEWVTGRGAGLTTAGRNRKAWAIKEGIRTHRPSGEDPVGTLPRMDGLDSVAPTSFYIGCAARGLPAMLDGSIAGVATLATVRISPDIKEYLLASHVLVEPTGAMVLDILGLKPAISAGMCLGGGADTAALLPFLDMATSVYTRMSSFGKIRVDAYEYLV